MGELFSRVRSSESRTSGFTSHLFGFALLQTFILLALTGDPFILILLSEERRGGEMGGGGR